jgi:methionyl-tRNA synthetase
MSNEINMSYDDFIRTTEERHKIAAQTLWKMIEKDIYKSTYAGWYSARDEEYIAENEVVDGRAPSGAPLEWMEEESYFFKLSSFQGKLLEWYEKNPDSIAPASRRNEVINFVNSGLRDLSISRGRFDWGIQIPNHDGQVMYVWVDALTNYITSLGFPDNMERVSTMMANCVHIVGKEILRFHAVYWPALLMSAGLQLPQRIFAHGWWTSEGRKMSKSIGNVVEPHPLIEKYGVDPIRYFLFKEVKFGEDGDFSKAALQNRVNYDLANDLGNLVQRVLVFIQQIGAHLTVDYNFSAAEEQLFNRSRRLIDEIRPLIDKQNVHGALGAIWELISVSNKFVNDTKPWDLATKCDITRLNRTLTVLCESIRAIGFCLAPFLPDTARKIFNFLNVEGKTFGEMECNFVDQDLPKPAPLFPREQFMA